MNITGGRWNVPRPAPDASASLGELRSRQLIDELRCRACIAAIAAVAGGLPRETLRRIHLIGVPPSGAIFAFWALLTAVDASR